MMLIGALHCVYATIGLVDRSIDTFWLDSPGARVNGQTHTASLFCKTVRPPQHNGAD